MVGGDWVFWCCWLGLVGRSLRVNYESQDCLWMNSPYGNVNNTNFIDKFCGINHLLRVLASHQPVLASFETDR